MDAQSVPDSCHSRRKDAAQVAVANPASLLFLDGTYGHKTAERGFGRLKGKTIAYRSDFKFDDEDCQRMRGYAYDWNPDTKRHKGLVLAEK